MCNIFVTDNKGLAPTRLGTFLEDRVNNFLRQSNVSTGEITIRLVSNIDKTLTRHWKQDQA